MHNFLISFLFKSIIHHSTIWAITTTHFKNWFYLCFSLTTCIHFFSNVSIVSIIGCSDFRFGFFVILRLIILPFHQAKGHRKGQPGLLRFWLWRGRRNRLWGRHRLWRLRGRHRNRNTGDIGTTRCPSPIPRLVLAALITRGYPLVSGTVSRSCRQRKTHTTN